MGKALKKSDYIQGTETIQGVPKTLQRSEFFLSQKISLLNPQWLDKIECNTEILMF